MASLAVDQQHIPLPSTSLIGRSVELARVTEMLGRADVRLVTLTGPGGVGKTRLALQLARDIDRTMVGDVILVLLANAPDADAVLPAIARALGINQIESVSLEDQIAEAIDDRRLLLILDNAEHVAGNLTVVASMLARCPNLKTLVTSRVMLRLSAEHVVPVEPLPTASTSSDALAPATALFVERARAVRPDLELTPENVRAIDDICRQVDGLPLAIELAAARTRFLSPGVLHDRLSERLPVLVGGPRDAPERHQTMRATLIWSHDLLTDDEKTLFRWLAVFRNGAPYDAVEPVCNAEGALGIATEELLASLVDHSLVRIIDRPATGPRVRLLNTIREFAQEQLENSDDEDQILDAHARWFAQLVIAQPQENWRTGTRELRDWTVRHEPDVENFRQSLTWLAEHGDHLTIVELVSGIVPFWLELGYVQDGREWTQHAMPLAGNAPLDVQARLNYMASIMAVVSDEMDDALDYLHSAIELADRAGNRRLVANCQNLLGTIYWEMGRDEEGERLQRQAIDTIRSTSSDDLGGAMFLANIGEHLLERGELERAEALIREALPIIREHRPDAVPLFQGPLAFLVLSRGALDEAGELLEGSLEYHREPPHRQPHALAERFHNVAQLAARRGEPHHGGRLLGVADAILARTGMAHYVTARNSRERTERELRRGLDEKELDREVAIGKAMSIPDAITLAQQIAQMRTDTTLPAARSDSADDLGLTDRQRDVLRLLAEGKSNAAIADALFISERTVTTHLTRIYDRLGVAARAEAIAKATQLGIAGSDHT